MISNISIDQHPHATIVAAAAISKVTGTIIEVDISREVLLGLRRSLCLDHGAVGQGGRRSQSGFVEGPTVAAAHFNLLLFMLPGIEFVLSFLLFYSLIRLNLPSQVIFI